MPGSQDSSEKSFTVNQSVTGINSIGNRSDGGNADTILKKGYFSLDFAFSETRFDRMKSGLIKNNFKYLVISS